MIAMPRACRRGAGRRITRPVAPRSASAERGPDVEDVLVGEPAGQVVAEPAELLEGLVHGAEREGGVPGEQYAAGDGGGEVLAAHDPRGGAAGRREAQQQVRGLPVAAVARRA